MRGLEPISPWWIYGLTFVLAAGLAAWLTPRVRRAALRFGIVDRPDGRLKTHAEPVAYLGGLAIGLAFLLAVSLTFEFQRDVLGMLLAGSIVVVLGLVDDLGGLGAWTKLFGQGIAVWVLIKAGIAIELVFLPAWAALPLSVLWLLATTNAFNLIDIMDGLSAGTAAVAACVLLVFAHLDGSVSSATLLAALAGACAGFLRYNVAPAKIYMGDTGSMLLGLMLGALSMSNAYTERNALAAIAPALVLGVPLFDMVFVMYIRYRRGLPVMLGSPDHVALRLRKWRLSTRQTVAASWAATALLGGAALAMSLLALEGAATVLGVVVVLALAGGFLLNRIDMKL